MIGEVAVAMRTRRTATVKTVTFTELLSLSRRVFQDAAREVPETARAMTGYAVKRMRVALWKRVRAKKTFIACVNAIRTEAGYDVLSVAIDKERGVDTRGCAGADAGADSDSTTMKQKPPPPPRSGGSRGGILRAGSFSAATTTTTSSSTKTATSEPETHPDVPLPAFLSPRRRRLDDGGGAGEMKPSEFYDLGVESARAPYLTDASSDAALGMYYRHEVEYATSLTSLCAYAAQRLLHGLDDDDGGGGGGGGGVDRGEDAARVADELVVLLRRLGSHVEVSAERVESTREMQSSRGGDGGGHSQSFRVRALT
jgi:hypothetical protein